MKRIIISEEEKSRILGMHVEATKRHYGLVNEQQTGNIELSKEIVEELISQIIEPEWQGFVKPDPNNYYADITINRDDNSYRLNTFKIVLSQNGGSFSVFPSGNVFIDPKNKKGKIEYQTTIPPTGPKYQDQSIIKKLDSEKLVKFIKFHAETYPNFKKVLDNMKQNSLQISQSVTDQKVRDVYTRLGIIS